MSGYLVTVERLDDNDVIQSKRVALVQDFELEVFASVFTEYVEEIV